MTCFCGVEGSNSHFSAKREGDSSQSVLQEILMRLDVDSICITAPVCRNLRFSTSEALSSISILDLSGFSPDAQILDRILNENKVLKSLTLGCIRLNDLQSAFLSKTIFRNWFC